MAFLPPCKLKGEPVRLLLSRASLLISPYFPYRPPMVDIMGLPLADVNRRRTLVIA